MQDFIEECDRHQASQSHKRNQLEVVLRSLRRAVRKLCKDAGQHRQFQLQKLSSDGRIPEENPTRGQGENDLIAMKHGQMHAYPS